MQAKPRNAPQQTRAGDASDAAAVPPFPADRAVIGIGLVAGSANVIMQLARPEVGYGVFESTVESGQIFRHPIKRTRTTLTYLAVATMGSDEEKSAYRRAVNGAHAQVRSTPSSPVAYNAFDPELQLWVAACLYRGFADSFRLFGPPTTEEELDRLYRSAASLGTTLQMPAELWPADREAFEAYWQAQLEQARIDEPVRQYLWRLAELRFLPQPVPFLFGAFNRFLTTGFLPPRLREQMHLPWDARRQRRFDRLMGVFGAINRRLPRVLRQFPINWCLWDLRRRLRRGRPLV